MAIGGGSAGVSSGGRRHRRRPVMSEINVTPMVDVMLVLLIIFMVAAPLLTTSLDIDLPVARGGSSANPDEPPLTLSVKRSAGACNSKADLFLGDSPIERSELEAKLKAVGDTRKTSPVEVYVRGDRDTCYADMMRVLGNIRAAGFKVNIVIIPEQGS